MRAAPAPVSGLPKGAAALRALLLATMAERDAALAERDHVTAERDALYQRMATRTTDP